MRKGPQTQRCRCPLEAGESKEITSVEALQQKTMLSKEVMEILEKNHVFDNISKTDQLSIFDI